MRKIAYKSRMSRQQSLPLPKNIHPDRNAANGGKSFYFFDLDENIFHVNSAHYVFHKDTGVMLEVPGKLFWQDYDNIGKIGFLKDYQILPDDELGSFRRFRDIPSLPHSDQPFIEDLLRAIASDDWMGPSWDHFYHAVLNQRPLAVITARGHHPSTIREGLKIFVEKGFLPHEPNYLAILPVSHPETQKQLAGGTVPELKRRAIRHSVELAFKVYGESPFHRFGMSDDDPKNVKKIIEEFTFLKRDYPQNAFFIIETTEGQVNKWEVFSDHAEKTSALSTEQLSLL